MKSVLGIVLAIGLTLLGVQRVVAQELIRYGVPPTPSPVYVALGLGLFAPIEEKDHIRFIFPHYQNGSLANEAMGAGDLLLSSEDAGSCLIAASRLRVTLVAIDVFGQSALESNAECVSDAFLAKHPDVVQDILNALVRASAFIRTNPDAAAKLFAPQIGMPQDVIRASLIERMSAYKSDITPSKSRVDAYLKRLRRANALKATERPKVDPSFARKVTR